MRLARLPVEISTGVSPISYKNLIEDNCLLGCDTVLSS
jgi:hypothetical protein